MSSIGGNEVFELQRRVLRLETLYDAALTLPRERSPVEIITEILERGVAMLDARSGLGALLGADSQVEQVVGAGHHPLPEAERFNAEPLVADLLSANGVIGIAPARVLAQDHEAVLGVSLRGQAGPLAVILLFDRETRGGGGEPFAEEDERFLSALASLGTQALEGSRRLARLEEDRRRLLEENRLLRGRRAGEDVADWGLVGQSPALRRAVEVVRRVATSGASLLIRGESGTGKELIARLAHAESDRHDGPLVALNCSAIPETLLESELFGIERGVATGVDARPGKFELADGGTLFLDEIGDMPLALQAKLLRTLAEREVERVGGRRPRSVDVRVIAATHRPLEAMVENGTFRRDLYYRLRVIEVTLPPLRQRREDIPLLLRHFLDRARGQQPTPTFTREARAWLSSYDYPGNVRELENLVEGALALAQGSEVDASDLALLIPDHVTPAASTPSREDDVRLLREVQQQYVERAVTASGGNKSLAARRLGIDRKTVDRLVGKK